MNPATWDALIAQLPGAHVLQTWEWGQVKARIGWQLHPLIWYRPPGSAAEVRIWRGERDEPALEDLPPVAGRAAALLLVREVRMGRRSAGLRVAYAPKGPLLDWEDVPLRQQVLSDLAARARQLGAIYLKIDPDVRLGTGVPGEPNAREEPLGHALVDELQTAGWGFSPDQVQYRNTVLVNLDQPEEALLAGMKQKTRYNIRLASRRGVQIRPGGKEDLNILYRMYAETSARDGFVIRDQDYYFYVWRTFMAGQRTAARPGPGNPVPDRPLAEPLIATVDDEPVAGVVIMQYAGKAWFLYGMSRAVHREKMPNYLLQWEAMRRARRAGCRLYDLWGAPDEFTPQDPMWGVFRFKQGFQGTVVRHIGAWDLPLRPALYRLYTQALPWVLGVMRRRGRARLNRMFDSS